MVVNRRKKVAKYRGHTTHGGGHRKKRRGAGSRGGRGNAGSGKRAGHMKIDRSEERRGFINYRSRKEKAINVCYFTTEKLIALHQNGKVKKEGDVYIVRIKDLGYQKLLGTGIVSSKLTIYADSYSKRAEEKIAAAGGQIVQSQGQESLKNTSSADTAEA